MKRNASSRTMRHASSLSAADTFLRCEWCSGSISTDVTEGQPRESNSRLMLPVPENRSSADDSSKSTLFISMLNRFSFAKSVVGRALKLRGTSK